MSKGWIKLDRQTCDHWLWKDQPFSYGQAWVDLLLNANHKPAKLLIKNKLIEINRGDQARSEVTLSKDWGWSRGKVRRFLELLKNDQMIVQRAVQVTSVITICNYDSFQHGDTVDGTASKTVLDTVGGQDTVHKQECKNEKKLNNSDLFDAKKPKAQAIPYQLIIDCYHECLPNYSRVMKLTDKRKTLIAKFWKDDERHRNIEFYKNYFSDIPNKPWLNGDVQPGEGRQQFRADLDWLLNINNFTKVLEGKYNV